VVGSSMDAHHSLSATMYIRGKVFKVYEANASNMVEFGMFSNKTKLIADANELQYKTLSNDLMKAIYADRSEIEKAIK